MALETRYAKSGDVNIAYQVVGDGPLDLVFVMGWVSHLDGFWEEPDFARFLRRLASFSRLILFDKRGSGPLPALFAATYPDVDYLCEARSPPSTWHDSVSDLRAACELVASPARSAHGRSRTIRRR